MRMIMLAAAAASLVTVFALPATANAASVWIASAGNNQCLANSGGNAVLQACSGSRTAVSFPYNGGTNEFYGTLTISGQCLDVVNNQVKFAACNGKPSQTWKLAGATTQLNDGAGYCIGGSGGSVAVRPCPANGTWYNASYIPMPALATVPKGVQLKVSGDGKDVLNAQSGAVLLKGLGPTLQSGIVAAGAGNIVAAGAGNIVAAGAGNIVVSTHAANIVAAGAGN